MDKLTPYLVVKGPVCETFVCFLQDKRKGYGKGRQGTKEQTREGSARGERQVRSS